MWERCLCFALKIRLAKDKVIFLKLGMKLVIENNLSGAWVGREIS